MAFALLHTVQTMAKRFNDRMKKITEQLGKDNPITEKYKAKLDVLLPDNYAMKGGYPVIKNPAEIFNDEKLNDEFDSLMQDMPTWTDIKKTYQKDYEEYISTFESRDIPTLSDFIKDMEELPQLLTWVYNVDSDDAQKALQIMKNTDKEKEQKRIKSYAEIHEFMDKVKQAQVKQKAEPKPIKKKGRVSELLDKYSKIRGRK